MSQQDSSEESVSAARSAYERLDEAEKANKDVAVACELLKGAEEALESGEEDEEQSILDQVLDAITGGTLAEVDGNTVTLTYQAGTGGTVSSSSEEVEENGQAVGSTAEPEKNYHFKSWTNSKGEVVSTSKTFVPPKPDNGYTAETYTANFYRLSEQTAYFYILKPGFNVEDASDKDVYTKAWYYVGTGTVLGTDPKDGESGGVASVVRYPSNYPTIPLDGVNYDYFDGIGTPLADGNYYTVNWSMPSRTSPGANNGNEILTQKNT